MLALGRHEVLRSEGGEGGGGLGYNPNPSRDREIEYEQYGGFRERHLDERIGFGHNSNSSREVEQEWYRDLEAEVLRYTQNNRDVEQDLRRFAQNPGNGRYRS